MMPVLRLWTSLVAMKMPATSHSVPQLWSGWIGPLNSGVAGSNLTPKGMWLVRQNQKMKQKTTSMIALPSPPSVWSSSNSTQPTKSNKEPSIHDGEITLTQSTISGLAGAWEEISPTCSTFGIEVPSLEGFTPVVSEDDGYERVEKVDWRWKILTGPISLCYGNLVRVTIKYF